MPWCPNCKTEYRNGFLKCADCGTDLVDELQQETSDLEPIPPNTPVCPCLLISVSDEIQAKLIENLLGESDIPCFVQDKGCGAYLKVYMGYSAFGTEIYVDQGNYPKAKELVDAYLSQSADIDDNEGEPSDDIAGHSPSIRKTVMMIMIVILLLSSAIGLVFSLSSPLFQ